jgi:hypothetical protein
MITREGRWVATPNEEIPSVALEPLAGDGVDPIAPELAIPEHQLGIVARDVLDG